jgi:hypothetical protein
MADTTPDSAKDAARAAAKVPEGILNALLKPATASADALNAVAKGGLNFGGVLSSAGNDLTKFSSLTGLAGTGLKIFGEYAQESVDAMRNFSKVGAGFSGDAIGMRASIAQTNMSLEQYSKFLNTNTALLNGMGGTVSQGAKAFNAFSADFFVATSKTKTELGTFGDQLRNLGMTSEEINGVLALELTSRRFTNMQDAANRDAALESAKALAEEMDKTAKLTGKSREEQQKSLAALERDGKYQAAIRLEMMNGNKFAAEGMVSAMAKVEKFGPGVQNLTKDLVSYGTASKDTAATLSALGPAGTQLQNAINMAKTARTEEQKEAAARAVSEAELAVQARLNSREFTAMASVGIKGAQDIANQTTTLTAGMDKIAAEQNLNLNLESDRRKAVQALTAQSTKEQTDAKTPAKPGAEDQGKATTQMVVQFESSLQKASAAINDQFIKRLNDEIAPAMSKFTKQMQDIPQDTYNRRAEDAYGSLRKMFGEQTPIPPAQAAREEAQAKAKGEQAANEAREAAKKQGLPEASQEARAKIAREQAEREERQRIQRERLPTSNGPMPSTRGGSESDPVFVRPVPGTNIPTPAPTPNVTPRPTPVPERAFGSLDMAGKMFEDWGNGTMVELHGLESVMRPQDLSKVIESAMGGVRKTMPKIDVGAAGNNLEMPKFEMPTMDMSKFEMPKFEMPTMDMPKFEMPTMDMSKLDLSKISQSITTSLSSVTGGNATTIRGEIPGYKDPGLQIPGASLTQNTAVEKLAQEQAADAKKKQAESSVASAKLYKDSSEKFVSFLEKDIAAKEQELATTDSERTKRRLENELANQRTKLSNARDQVIEDIKDLLDAENELATIQQESTIAETALRDEAIKQTSSIAEQTQSMLAVKKEFLNSELIQIGEELSALGDEKSIQLIRESSIQDGLDKLKAEKDIYENNQKYDERDLAESTEELAMLRNRIDNSDSESEILELQKQVSIEEALNLSLQTKIAERNQNILNTDADIALKEQELQDLREEMADTEVAIQDKREQLLDSVVGQDEEVAMPGAVTAEPDTEFGDLDGAMKYAQNAPGDEWGDLDGAIAKNKPQPVAGKDPFARMLDKFMGPMAEPGKALAPAEAAKTSVTAQSDAAAKQAATDKAKAAQGGSTGAKDSDAAKTAAGSKEATLSDVVKSLDTLNKQVGLLNGEMSKLPNLMEKAVSATKSLNGNLNARVT